MEERGEGGTGRFDCPQEIEKRCGELSELSFHELILNVR